MRQIENKKLKNVLLEPFTMVKKFMRIVIIFGFIEMTIGELLSSFFFKYSLYPTIKIHDIRKILHDCKEFLHDPNQFLTFSVFYIPLTQAEYVG